MKTDNIRKELEAKQIQEITDKFKNLIAVEVEAVELSNILDDIIFEYTQYLVQDEYACGGNEKAGEQLRSLKQIRDILRNK